MGTGKQLHKRKKQMTPREKALDLIDKMYSISGHRRFSICYALICSEEIEEVLNEYGKSSMELQNMDSELRFWDKVKIELKSAMING